MAVKTISPTSSLAVELHYRRQLMKTIKLIGFASALTFGLVACGGGGGDIKGLAEEACKCTTKECGEAVNKKMDKAIEGIKSEKELEGLTESLTKAGICLGKLGVSAE